METTNQKHFVRKNNVLYYRKKKIEKINSVTEQTKEQIWLDFLSGVENSNKLLAKKYNVSESKIAAVISQKFQQKKM